jgi:hypothetical protein
MSQHEFHPGAESLSAFAEQALDARERGQVLAHLAVCARCRTVVSLAREAAEAELAATSVTVGWRRAVGRSEVWWRSWRIALVPVAALAATTAIALYIHLDRVKHDAELAKNAPSIVSHIETPATNTARSVQAEAAPPAPPPAPPANRKPTSKASAATAVPPAQEPSAGPVAPPPAAVTETVEVAQDQAKPEPARPRRESATEALPLAGTPAYFGTPSAGNWQSRQKAQASDKKRTDLAVTEDRSLATNAAPTTSGSGADGAAQSNNGSLHGAVNASALVSSQQIEVRPESLGSFGATKTPRAAAVAASPMRPVLLPSGLTVRSIASANHRSLAIDKAGALFVSDDGGMTWKAVTTQWSGRAVMVFTQKPPIEATEAGAQAAPPATTSGNPAGSAAGSTSSPTTFFEIINDRNEKWWSADGLFWIAK